MHPLAGGKHVFPPESVQTVSTLDPHVAVPVHCACRLLVVRARKINEDRHTVNADVKNLVTFNNFTTLPL